MNFSSIEFFHSGQLIFKPLIFDNDILILVKQIIDLELKL